MQKVFGPWPGTQKYLDNGMSTRERTENKEKTALQTDNVRKSLRTEGQESSDLKILSSEHDK